MNEKILRKIKRCLALAKSSNANEAATALRQAQALMQKHQISKSDISAADICSHCVSVGAGIKPPVYIVGLINLIRKAFGVEMVYRSTYNGSRWEGGVEFIGFEGAAEVAGYAMTVLGRQLKLDRTAYLKNLAGQRRSTKTRRADLYARAWVKAVGLKVITSQISEVNQTAFEVYKARNHGKLKFGKSLDRGFRVNDSEAFSQGLKDGERVQFYQGMRREGSDPLALRSV